MKREAVDLAKKRKDFIVLKQKADEINDPHVHAAVKKTEGDLNQRHLHMMGAHNDIDKHQKESLDMQGQLGHKQITAHIVNGTDFSGMSQDEIDLYKNRYEELQQEMEAMLADKEKQYQAEVEAAKKHMLEASEYVAAKMKEKHQAMFKEMMKERVHTTNELVKGKKKQAEMEKRDAEEAAELWVHFHFHNYARYCMLLFVYETNFCPVSYVCFVLQRSESKSTMIYNILIYLLCLIDFVISSTMDKANQLLAQGRMPEAADAYSDVIAEDPK